MIVDNVMLLHAPDLTTKTIADQVFAEIRQAIVAGELASGSKLSEQEMAARFGISRGPLREALRRLEASHLVERRANCGARVVTLSFAGLIEIYQLREALEGLAARLAAEVMSPAQIEDLRALLTQHRDQVAADPSGAYFQREGDLDFHFRIAQGSRNARLIGMLCNDLYYLARMYRYQFGMTGERSQAALDEHGLIVEAIAARDGELAEWLTRRHIRASRRHAEQRLGALQDEAREAE
jgi:DNA-binding GntR family transcriptional regulator